MSPTSLAPNVSVKYPCFSESLDENCRHEMARVPLVRLSYCRISQACNHRGAAEALSASLAYETVGRPDACCRFRAAALIVRILPSQASEMCSRVLCMASIVVSPAWVRLVLLVIEHLLGGADDRHPATQVVQDLMYSWRYPCIGNMCAVPRQQVVYPVIGHQGNVQRVKLGLGGQDGACHDLLCDSVNLRGKVQQRKTIQCQEPLSRQVRVAIGRLVEHILRNNEFVFMPLVFPPAPREHLPGRRDQLVAGQLTQVTYDGCFDIQSGRHEPLFSCGWLWRCIREQRIRRQWRTQSAFVSLSSKSGQDLH